MLGTQLRVTMFLLFCAVSLSAQTPCTVTLPITVVTQDGTIAKHFPSESLTLRMKEKSLHPDFAADDSKRRILIVLDGSSHPQKASLAAQKWMARAIVEMARSGDSFALISGNAAPVRLPFGADQTLALKAIDNFPKGQKGKKLGLLDAVHEGSTWFGVPEFGDTVLLLPGTTSIRRSTNTPEHSGEGLDGLIVDRLVKDGTDLGLGNRGWDTSNNSDRPADHPKIKTKIEPKDLQNALMDRGLRLFVASQRGTFDVTQDVISRNSGGLHYVYPESKLSMRDSKLDDASRNTLSATAAKVFDAITVIHRVSVSSSGAEQTQVSLDLRPDLGNKLIAVYPRAIPGCSSK